MVGRYVLLSIHMNFTEYFEQKNILKHREIIYSIKQNAWKHNCIHAAKKKKKINDFSK